METFWEYSQTVNQQDNPNTPKRNDWKNIVKTVGLNLTGWATSTYTRKTVNKTVDGKKVPVSVEYTGPETLAAADFRLTKEEIPERAYVKRIIVEARMKCDAGLDVNAPSAHFMIYRNKNSPKSVKEGVTGWHNDVYAVFPKEKLSSTRKTIQYVMDGKEWRKAGYPVSQLYKTIMGVDFHFPAPNKMSANSQTIYISWVRIKVEFELEEPYLKVGTPFRDDMNPNVVEAGKLITIPFEFGNRNSHVNGGNKSVRIRIPAGMSLVSYDFVKNNFESTFAPVGDVAYPYATEYKWNCKCIPSGSSTIRLRLRADTLGDKVISASLGEIAVNGYNRVIGISDDFGSAYVTNGNIQKGQLSCFNFYTRVNSMDSQVAFDVIVDGEGQSNPEDMSVDFCEFYNNPDGTGNNLVGNWSLDDSSAIQGVSLNEELSNNHRVVFDIPEDTDLEIRFTGCFIPVTVGQNTLYLTNLDTGDTYSHQYTSLAPNDYVMNPIPDETTWYDHWITTRMDTGTFILPFATKLSDRTMVEGDCDLVMNIEKPRAYIGCIPLPRSHYEPSSDFSNKIIKEQYKNTIYMGKTNEIDESIDFKIKLPPKDWTTLQGLCELDKPVPVNAVPTAFEGDVINHRGWVELGGVKNVKKTNPLYYDGELELEYLTHNINTLFQITAGKKVNKNYNTSILNSMLGYVIESGDEFADYVHKDLEGNIVHNGEGYFDINTDGVYIYDEDMPENQRTLIALDNSQFLVMKTIEPLKETTEIDFEWFSTKITENRENNVSRVIRLVDEKGNPVMEYEYYNYEFDYDDELYSCTVKCNTFTDDGETETIIDDDLHFAVDIESLDLMVDSKGNLVQEIEPENEDEEEEDDDDTESTYIDPETGEEVDYVSQAEVYNDYMFGSKLTLTLNGNNLSINDAGFNGREVYAENIPLETGKYYLEVKFKNNNIDSDTSDVLHFFDFEIQEPVILSDFNEMYSNLLVSSYPLPDKEFVFIRDSEEGKLYYYHNDGSKFIYNQEPFYMYDRGVDLTAGAGQSIFNLNNSYTTFYVQNGLVRIGFNRLTGRVYLAKYDLMAREYITVSTLQLNKYSNFSIGAYSDDKIEVKVANTVFSVYRGHPYVVVKHPKTDIQFVSTFNKIYSDGIDGQNEEYPVMWDLMNHENLLSDCVGGIDLKSSCLEVEEIPNENVGTTPTITLIPPEDVHNDIDALFEVNGSVSNIDEEIPLEGDFTGIFGEYSIGVTTDKSKVARVDLSSDNAVTPNGEPFVVRAKVTDYDYEGIGNVKVMFYEEQ